MVGLGLSSSRARLQSSHGCRGQRAVFSRDLLAKLQRRELDAVTKLAAETGLTYQPAADGERVSGVYRRVALASGCHSGRLWRKNSDARCAASPRQ
jgi:hypothetical protein